MAIAWDATSYGATTGTSVTVAHTVSAGSNTILISAPQLFSGLDAVTGVTYNGTTMTFSNKTINFPSGCSNYVYSLVAPTSGTHNVVGSASSSISFHLFSVSYTGAAQSGQPNDSDPGTASSASSITINNVTTVDNCWQFAVMRNGTGHQAISVGVARSDQDSFGVYDTNGSVGTAGTHGVTFSGSTANYGGVAIAIAPSVATTRPVPPTPSGGVVQGGGMIL